MAGLRSGLPSIDPGADPLVAQCRACGGPVPLRLAGPPLQCPRCDEPRPLEPELDATLAQVRARLEGRAAKQRHLGAKLASAVTGLQGLALALGLTLWGLFGAMALVLALDHDVPLLAFIAGQTLAGELGMHWWTLWSVAAGLPLSVLVFSICLLRLRSLALAALPLPPLDEGAAPRCRACAAELPAGLTLRRCRYCSCDNLVLGARYQARETGLDAALGHIAARFEDDLGARIRSADAWLLRLSLIPLALPLLAPVVGLFAPALPWLWLSVPLFTAAAALVLLVARSRRLPPLEALACLVVGAEVSVGGAPMQVRAQLVRRAGDHHEVLNLLAEGRGADADLAFRFATRGRRWDQRLWTLEPGGAALEADAYPQLESAELLGADSLDVMQLHRGAELLRVWPAEGLEPGAPPRWTLRPLPDAPLVLDA